MVTEPGGHPWRGCKIKTFSHTARDDAEYLVGRLSDVTGPAEKAVAGLAELGFAAESLTVPAWRAAEEDARRVLAAPLYPTEWFSDDARGYAQALVDLDEAVRESHDLTDKMPEFDSDGLRNITDPRLVAELTPDRERVAGAAELTVRARVATLNRIGATLRTLAQLTTDLHATARNVAGLLRCPYADRGPPRGPRGSRGADRRGAARSAGWWDGPARKSSPRSRGPLTASGS